MLADMIIVIPGIMGSVLARRVDGDEDVLWDPGPNLAGQLLRHRRWVESLRLVGPDDPADPGWVDDIVPVGLVRSRSIVPGLVRIDGYSELDTALHSAFGAHLIEGDALAPRQRVDGKDPGRFGVPNYYRFAYDWRRDLRASALRLHQLIDETLPLLRQQRSPQAKVIFITHSMGGLVARYYTEGIDPQTGERFEGWRNTRELLSFGTPYRGSLDAVAHLVNGFRKLFVDFSQSLRSFTGVYQLLPRYRAVGHNGNWLYPHEIGSDVEGFDPTRALAAYQDFHLTIEDGVDRHRQDPTYNRNHVIPVIGYGHSTHNSALLTERGIEVAPSLPAGVPPALAGGDGTVPLVSAIPLDYAAEGQNHGTVRYANQEHGSLQVDRRVMATEIQNRLRAAQTGTGAIRGPGDQGSGDPTGQPHLAVDLAQLWLRGADRDHNGRPAGRATVSAHNADVDRITVSVTDLAARAQPVTLTVASGESFPLPDGEGSYAVTATAAGGLETTTGYAVLDGERGG
jgi:hypothetical protein